MTTMVEEQIGNKLRAYCSECKGQRNCQVRGHYAESGGDENYQWHRTWYLLTCCGCDHVFAQSVSTDSDSYTPYYDRNGDVAYEYNETVVMWPAKAKRARPEWFEGDTLSTEHNTEQLDAALRELYGALDHDLNVLASIGIRTSFDIAAEILGVDQSKHFQAKIEALVLGGFIKESEKEHINILVDAGSASAHRGWQPRIGDLDALMDTLEDFLYNNFVLPAQAKAKAARLAKVKAKVPPKPKKRAERKKGT